MKIQTRGLGMILGFLGAAMAAVLPGGAMATPAMASEEVWTFESDLWVNRCELVRNAEGVAVGERCDFPQAEPLQMVSIVLRDTPVPGRLYGSAELPVETKHGVSFQGAITITKSEQENSGNRRYLVQIWVRSAAEGEDFPARFDHIASVFVGNFDQWRETTVSGSVHRLGDQILSPWIFLGAPNTR